MSLSRGKLATLVVVLSCFLTSPGMASPQDATDPQRWERLGPKADLSIYWVGHSLVEVKGTTDWGEHSLMTMLGRLAESRGLGYRMGDHTLWGTPISALWRGRPHSFARDASIMVPKREEFERTAGRYDTLVITEGLPLEPSLRIEYSAYYLRRFYCTLKQANPAARVYLYQTWVNFQGNDPYSKFPPAHKFDWRAEMVAQRKVWEQLADEASRAKVRAPSFLDKIGMTSTSDGGCSIEDPIFIVPAGQAFIALSDYLARQAPDKVIKLPGGEPFTIGDVFGNPYVDWPADWPLRDDVKDVDPAAVLASLKRRKPSDPHDDIHASQLGVYFVALVHFATLYRQSPVGLPAPALVGDEVARTLQCIAWQTVVNDPRSGVLGNADDCKL
jgi:hypothetical protein